MEVELAKKSGFCFGVKRAVDRALNLNAKCNTIGPLIHNPQVIEELKKKGIIPVEKIDDIDSSTVIIRTHGVPKKVIAELNKRKINVLDLTCPFVKKVQDYAIELEGKGYFVVVIGEKHHPEVEAIVGNLNNVAVVDAVEQIGSFGQHDKIGVVVQTTQTAKLFEDVVNELRKRYKEVKVCNTICNSTSERQNAALEVAEKSDVMIVIGGKNSANTGRLAELCSKVVEAHHIETADELKKQWFIGKRRAGVSSGASTPQNVADEVVKRIKNEF